MRSWAVRNDQYKPIADELGLKEFYDLLLDPFEELELIGSGTAPAEVIEELELAAANIRQ